jgi:hypothetical protein
MNVKASMKYYYLFPSKETNNGLLFLNDDLGCKKMSDNTSDGGVAEVFVEYHSEEDEEGSEKSESDFEDELGSEEENKDDISEPEVVLTADVSIIFSRNNIMNFHFYVSLFLPFYIFILIDDRCRQPIAVNVLLYCQFNIPQPNSCCILYHITLVH